MIRSLAISSKKQSVTLPFMFKPDNHIDIYVEDNDH
jgi:hypothetical protein